MKLKSLILVIFLMIIYNSILFSQNYLSNLSATKDSPLFTTYTAPLNRSEFTLDEGYQFKWYNEDDGINFETDNGGSLCLGFKLNNDFRYKLSQMYKEPVITTSYSDLVKYYYYPFPGIRVEVFFDVYSSHAAIESVKIINENDGPVNLSAYTFFYHMNDVVSNVKITNEGDGFTFKHQENPDGWTLAHNIPYQQDIIDAYIIDTTANSFGAYFDPGTLDIKTSLSTSLKIMANYCVEWGTIMHADSTLDLNTPPAVQQVIYLNNSVKEILTEDAPKFGETSPNIPGNGYQGCELGNFNDPAIAEGDSFRVVFSDLATSERGVGIGIIPSLPASKGVNVNIKMEKGNFPKIPQNVSAHFSLNNESAVLQWDQVPGYLYDIYRRTASTPGRYSLIADSINDSGYFDFNLNPDSIYGYVVIGIDSIGDRSGHSPEVGNIQYSYEQFFTDITNQELSEKIPDGDLKIAALQKDFSIPANGSVQLRIIRGVAPANTNIDSLVNNCRNLTNINLNTFVTDDEQEYSRIPRITFTDKDKEMMYWSAFSMMRQCMLPPEGQCSYNYNVYSREPQWGWGHAGQVFHENLSMLAYAYMDPQSAENSQKVFAEQMDSNPNWQKGYIPYRTGPYLNEVNYLAGEYSSNAPWFSYENWEIFEAGNDTSFLKDIYDKSKEFYNFWVTDRDDNKDGLSEWGGHSFWESVRDYNVIWDLLGGWSDPHSANKVDALDLNCELVMEAKSLSKIAYALGMNDEAVQWLQKAQQRANLINKYMWDDQTKFYYHVMKDTHTFTYQSQKDLKRKEQMGFLPMWAGIADSTQAYYLDKEIMNTNTFNRPSGNPLLSHSDPFAASGYYDQLSVYPEWVYLNFTGLLKYGYKQDADTIARHLFATVIQVLKDHHDFYESYYADAQRPSNSWLHTYIWTGLVARMILDLHNQTVNVQFEHSGLPVNYKLYQNYPNPFNPNTTISYEIPAPAHVTINVYDTIGRKVATIVNEEKAAGKYQVNFDAGDLSSGVYFFRIKSGNFVATKGMVLAK